MLSLLRQERIPAIPVASQEEEHSTGNARGTPGSCHHSKSPPRCLSPFQRNLFSLHCLDFQPRIDLHHGGTCDSPMGKPGVKASREIHRSQYQHEEKPDTATTAQKEKDLGCSHLKRGLTTLWRLQKCHKMHVNTGSESSGPELDPIRGLRPWHDRRVIPRGPLELARRLNFPEAIRARPWRPRHNSRAPAPTRENSGGSTLQAT